MSRGLLTLTVNARVQAHGVDDVARRAPAAPVRCPVHKRASIDPAIP